MNVTGSACHLRDVSQRLGAHSGAVHNDTHPSVFRTCISVARSRGLLAVTPGGAAGSRQGQVCGRRQAWSSGWLPAAWGSEWRWRVSFGFTAECPATRPGPAQLSLLKGCGHLLPGSLSPPGASHRPSGNAESDTSRMLGALLPCGQNPQPDKPARPQLSRTFSTLHASFTPGATPCPLSRPLLCPATFVPVTPAPTPPPTATPLQCPPRGPSPGAQGPCCFCLPLPQLRPVGFWLSPCPPWNPPPVRSEAGSDSFVPHARRQGG